MVEEQASNERERCDVVILLRPERPWRPQRPSPPISFKFFIFKPRAIFGELRSGPKYWDRVFVWAVMSSVCLWQSPPGLGWRQQRETRLVLGQKKMDTEKRNERKPATLKIWLGELTGPKLWWCAVSPKLLYAKSHLFPSLQSESVSQSYPEISTARWINKAHATWCFLVMPECEQSCRAAGLRAPVWALVGCLESSTKGPDTPFW